MFELSIFWFNSYLINHLLLNLASIVQVNKVQFDRILGFINQGKEQGAKLVAGKNTIQAGFAVLFPYIWQFHDDLVWFDEIWYDMKWFDLFNKKVVVWGGGLTSSYNFDLFKGGQRVGDLGYFVQPTVFAEVCKY